MKHLAVYAGSFDPPTYGHVDIVKRIAPLFDKIFLVVAKNPRKKTLFEAEERAALLKEALASQLKGVDIEVCIHDALLVDFCKQKGAKVLIRGLRAMSDFEGELQMASMNRKLAPGIETFHVMTDEKFSFISSSLIKELAHFDTNLKELVPKNVLAALKKKLAGT